MSFTDAEREYLRTQPLMRFATASPDGKPDVVQQVAHGAVSFTGTDEVGVYTLATGRAEMLIAANLMNGEESDNGRAWAHIATGSSAMSDCT